ncbi:MAG TPA: hypothetical protein VGV89_04430 [Thermoplasmata archaeon]|nr:hypothetical protein [Thermoplasmata archaeon]
MTRYDYTGPPTGYGYYQPGVREPGRITTSPTEIAHILIAAVVLSADIAFIQVRGFVLGGVALPGGVWLEALAIGVAAALTGFVFHELAHKIAAQRRGYWAEFRMSPMGLVFSVITAFIGFLFAAPGATVVQDMADRRDWGITGLAGPVVNLVEGGAFAAAGFGLFYLGGFGAWVPFLFVLGFFNGWFATFNLIPLGPLDGRKVLAWNTGVWAAAIVVSGLLAASAFLIAYGIVTL